MKKRISVILFLVVLCVSLNTTVFAAGSSGASIRLVDMADVLSAAEEAAIGDDLDRVSERQQLDVVIVTVNHLDGKSLMEYADDYYDENNYGFGSGKDGVLYLVNIQNDGSYEKGNSWISTTGYGITAFTDAGIQYIGKQITPDLLDENYADAFQKFLMLADDFVSRARNGEPFDVDSLPKDPFPMGGAILLSLIIGFVIALIQTRKMKKDLKSVRFQSGASAYVKRGGLQLTKESDVFLYAHVDRQERARESSSDGGSSTHTSSSGTTHGGGGF